MSSFTLSLITLGLAMLLIVFSVAEYRHQNNKASLIIALLAVICLIVSFSYNLHTIHHPQETSKLFSAKSTTIQSTKSRQYTLPRAMKTTVYR